MKLFNDLRDRFIATAVEKPVNSKFRQMAYSPIKGKAWNPLRKFPRNLQCFCGSLNKAKKCCLPHINECVSEEIAQTIQKNWHDILTRKMVFVPTDKGSQ